MLNQRRLQQDTTPTVYVGFEFAPLSPASSKSRTPCRPSLHPGTMDWLIIAGLCLECVAFLGASQKVANDGVYAKLNDVEQFTGGAVCLSPS